MASTLALIFLLGACLDMGTTGDSMAQIVMNYLLKGYVPADITWCLEGKQYDDYIKENYASSGSSHSFEYL